MVVGHAAAEHPRELFPGERGLLGREDERIVHGQGGGEFAREVLAGGAARGEDEDRPQVGQERLGDQPRPVAAERAGVQPHGQRVQQRFLQRHGPLAVRDEFRVAPQPPQPRRHVARVAHAAAEQQQLGVRRREREGQFVVRAPVGVAEHLVFVDDEQLRPPAAQQLAALGFQRGDDDARLGPLVDVARADAHVPTGGAPLGVLVVGQRAGGHGEHGLTLERGIQQLEHVGLARAGGRVDDQVAPRAQRRRPPVAATGQENGGWLRAYARCHNSW